MSNHDTVKTFKTSFLKASLLMGAGMSILAMPQIAYAQAAEDDVEEIVTTGYRQSLIDAANMKRNDSRISDAIVAEDIGKLPDNNVAEALQRITGVSINTDFGIGDSVSIRGLPQNRVELNGRSTVGDGRDGVSLQDFPSSFLKSVEVIKSPTPDMIEGALGGTVRLNTVRPLDLRKRTLAGSLDLEYADKTEHLAPIVNVTAGEVWDLAGGGRFGVIGSIAYQDRELREDFYHQRVRLVSDAIPGLTGNAPNGQFLVGDQNTVEQDVEKRERTALNLSLQYEPESGLGNIYLDLNTTDRSGSQSGSSILDVGGSRTYNADTTQDANGQVNNYELTGAFVIPKSFSQFRNTESFSHALGGEWNFTDVLNVSAEYSIASSESYAPDTEVNLRPINRTNWEAWVAGGGTDFNADRTSAGLRHTIDAFYTQSGDQLPSLTYSDGRALLDPENLALRRFQHDDRRTDNDESAFRFDVDYDDNFGIDFITNLKAGVRFTDNEYEFNRKSFTASNLYRNAFAADGVTPFAIWTDQFNAINPGAFQVIGHHNAFNQSGITDGGNDLLSYMGLNSSLLANPGATFEAFQRAFAGAVFADGSSIFGTGSLQDNLSVNEGDFANIQENTTAFYVSADLEFDQLSAVVGARFIETDLDSTVLENSAEKTESNTYDDLLPSLNVTYDYSDDVKIRFAAAKVMRRPGYGQLSSATSIDGNFVTANQGSFDLDPFRATQYDLSVEKYFGAGNLISGAIFYKDVESFFSNSTSCVANPLTVSAPQNTTEFENVCLLTTAGVDNPAITFSTDETFVNAERDAGRTGIRTNKQVNGQNGTVSGFELGYQQTFDFLPGAWSGFGINANYTYADSEQPNGNALLDISKNTFNLQGFWENEIFQARLAYNYRDEFLDTEEEKRVESIGARGLGSTTNDETDPNFDPTAGNNYRDARGQLDASAAWIVNDHFTVVANGTNLLGEPSTFSHELGSVYRYVEADRRFSVGVRGKF